MKNLALAAMALAMPLAAQAADIIDQNQPLADGRAFLTALPTAYTFYEQTFVQSGGAISGVGINFHTVGVVDPDLTFGDIDTVVVSIQRAGAIIASASQGIVDYKTGWLDLFWAPVAVTPQDQLTLVAEFDGGSQGFKFDLHASARDPYAKGRLTDHYRSSDDLGNPIVADDFYTSAGNYDMTFRTFAPIIGGAVPEPTTWIMMTVGFLLGASTMRRGRRPVVGSVIC